MLAGCSPPLPPVSAPAVSVTPTPADSPPVPPPGPASATTSSAEPIAATPPPSPRVVVTCNDCGMKPIPIVHFQYGSAVVSADAEPVLGEVVEAMKANPEITLVAVEGHADLNEGTRIKVD